MLASITTGRDATRRDATRHDATRRDATRHDKKTDSDDELVLNPRSTSSVYRASPVASISTVEEVDVDDDDLEETAAEKKSVRWIERRTCLNVSTCRRRNATAYASYIMTSLIFPSLAMKIKVCYV